MCAAVGEDDNATNPQVLQVMGLLCGFFELAVCGYCIDFRTCRQRLHLGACDGTHSVMLRSLDAFCSDSVLQQ
jgi:hypothetical protein